MRVVYEEGGTNIWKALAFKGSLYLIAGLVGGHFFLRYFFNGVSADEQTVPQKVAADAVQVFDTAGTYLGVENASGKVDPPKPVKVDEFAGLTGDQRYVAQLKDLGRVRLAARAEIGGRTRGWVEWVNKSGETVEQMEVAAVEALGYTAIWANFGVKLVAGDHTIIATPWPREIRVRDADQRLYNLSPSGGGGAALRAQRVRPTTPLAKAPRLTTRPVRVLMCSRAVPATGPASLS